MKIDRKSRRPMYLQLADELRRAIAAGQLPARGRLPSTRALARQLKLSRNTVMTAYDVLAAEGILTGRVGSGTLVTGRPRRRPPTPRDILRGAQYPMSPVTLRDPDGNPLYLHR